MIRIILFFITLNSSFAAGTEFYRFDDVLHKFILIDGIWVNGSCEDKKCEAYKKGKSLGDAKVDPKLLIGGKNPFAVRCKASMKGSVIIAKDLEKNDQSICMLSDGSYLILDTI